MRLWEHTQPERSLVTYTNAGRTRTSPKGRKDLPVVEELRLEDMGPSRRHPQPQVLGGLSDTCKSFFEGVDD